MVWRTSFLYNKSIPYSTRWDAGTRRSPPSPSIKVLNQPQYSGATAIPVFPFSNPGIEAETPPFLPPVLYSPHATIHSRHKTQTQTHLQTLVQNYITQRKKAVKTQTHQNSITVNAASPGILPSIGIISALVESATAGLSSLFHFGIIPVSYTPTFSEMNATVY